MNIDYKFYIYVYVPVGYVCIYSMYLDMYVYVYTHQYLTGIEICITAFVGYIMSSNFCSFRFIPECDHASEPAVDFANGQGSIVKQG